MTESFSMSDQPKSSETFVVFELAGTTYAVPSRLVQQMEMIEHITPVPNAPAWARNPSTPTPD